MSRATVPLLVASLCALLGAAGCALLGDGKLLVRSYSTPTQAVRSTCHPAVVVAVYSLHHRLQVNWESSEQFGTGSGFVAQLRRDGSHSFRVDYCKSAQFIHG
jgi:hypothetical protein